MKKQKATMYFTIFQYYKGIIKELYSGIIKWNIAMEYYNGILQWSITRSLLTKPKVGPEGLAFGWQVEQML